MRLALSGGMPRRPWSLALVVLAACSGDGIGIGIGDPTVPSFEVCTNGAEFSTIADAIERVPPGSLIEICEGTFPEILAITRSVHLRGAGVDETVLDAAGGGTNITISGDAEVTLEDLTIRGGIGDHGGCIHAAGRSVTIRGARIERCVADSRGGGLYLVSDGLVEDSELTANSAGWTGGAVHVAGSAPVFRRTSIHGNAAVHEGGGVYLHQSQAVFEDNEIRGNTSQDDGGGMRIFESECRLERNLIAENHSMTDGGGAKISHLPCVLIDNQIVDNIADNGGGGLELDNDSSQVRGGEVSRNKSSRGGGIHVMVWPWNDGVIEDVHIADNDAWRGGGIHLEDGFQPATLRRLIIERNDADQGGGIYATGAQLVLSNSVIAGNDADEGAGLFLAASEPWEDECPCPPVDPPDDIDFLVVHGNTPDDGGGQIWVSAKNLSIESSIVTGHTSTAVTVAPMAQLSWRFNDTYPATFAGMFDPTGSNGNLATEPQFAAAASGDYRLLSASACIDAGNPAFTDPDGSRADMGLHAGPGAP
jgi:hypothetical protein